MPPQNQESDSILGSEKSGTISEFVKYEFFSIQQAQFDPLDLAIVFRKGMRSRTQHPLSNFVSYKNYHHLTICLSHNC